MARIRKTGAEYFPMDVHSDERIRLIEAEFGLCGFAVIVKLWQKIYSEKGYYADFGDDSRLLFAKELGISKTDVEEITEAAINRGIFDKQMMKRFGILTSAEIQLQYLEIVSRRERVDLEKKFLLVSIPEKFQNVYIGGINVNINAENVDGGTQRKEKKRIEKHSIENKSASRNERDACEGAPRLESVKNKRPIGEKYKPKSVKSRSSGFCNFTDESNTDYDAIEEKLLEMMLEG